MTISKDLLEDIERRVTLGHKPHHNENKMLVSEAKKAVALRRAVKELFAWLREVDHEPEETVMAYITDREARLAAEEAVESFQ